MSAYSKDDYQGMVAASSRALAIDPRDADAYSNRAVGRQALGDVDGALEDFARAIALKPNTASYYANRASARRAKGDLAGNIEDYSQAIAHDPKNGDYYASRGNTKKDSGDLPGALADLNQAVALDPFSSDHYSDRGVARQMQGHFDDALSDYNRAISLDPNAKRAYANRGGLKAIRGDLDGAIADLDRAIALNPKSTTAYENRGAAKVSKRDLDGAIADFSRAIALDPAEADAYNGRGRAKTLKGDLTGAVEDFDQTIKLSPRYSLAYANRGAAKFARLDLPGAISDLNECIRLDGKNASAYRYRGNALLARNDFEQAAANYHYAIRLDPDEADSCRFFLWLARVQLHQNADADTELSASLAHRQNADPANVDSRIGNFLLGRIDETGFLLNTGITGSAAEQTRAQYYVGMKRLLGGDKSAAQGDFRLVASSPQVALPEHALARAELARTSADNRQLDQDLVDPNAHVETAGPSPAATAALARPQSSRLATLDPNAPISLDKKVQGINDLPNPTLPPANPLYQAVSPTPAHATLDNVAKARAFADRLVDRFWIVYWAFVLVALVFGVVSGGLKWLFQDWSDQRGRGLAIASLVLGLGSNAVYPWLLAPAAIICGTLALTKENRAGWLGLGFGIVGLAIPLLILSVHR